MRWRSGILNLRPDAQPGCSLALQTRRGVVINEPIVIAGAGVAGLTAAIVLRTAGRAVRVIDRAPASGSQRAPDWDAVENWTSVEDFPLFLQQIGVDRQGFRHVGHYAFTVIDPYGRRFDLKTPRPFYYLVKRGATTGGLERGLQSQAESLAIPITYNASCQPGAADIRATGSYGRGSTFVSTGFTFTTDHPDWVCGIVDTEIAPRAYAYLVVIEGEGTLAVVLTQGHRDANRLLERAVRVFQSHTELEMRDRHKSGGSGGDLAAFWQGHQGFVIGEAAGFQDFLWGFGIRHALASGYLAAQAILSGQSWQTLVQREIQPLVRVSLVNRWLYDRMPNRMYAALIHHFAQATDLNALMGRWYHPRLIHRLLWPVAARHFRRQSQALLEHERYRHQTRSE